jgi:hypothetical protein
MTRTATVTEIPRRVCRAHPITAAAQVVEDTIARSEQEALQVLAVVAVGVARLCEDIMHAVLLLLRATCGCGSTLTDGVGLLSPWHAQKEIEGVEQAQREQAAEDEEER